MSGGILLSRLEGNNESLKIIELYLTVVKF